VKLMTIEWRHQGTPYNVIEAGRSAPFGEIEFGILLGERNEGGGKVDIGVMPARLECPGMRIAVRR